MDVVLPTSLTMGGVMSLIVLAQAVTGAGDAATYREFSNIGIAIVICFACVSLLIWYFKTSTTHQREDLTRMAARIDTLENFINAELLQVAQAGNRSQDKITEANAEVSKQVGQLADAMKFMCAQLKFRPCFAMDAMTDEERNRFVVDIANVLKRIPDAH